MIPVAPPADKKITCLNCLRLAREDINGKESESQAGRFCQTTKEPKGKIRDKDFKTKKGSE